jgi:oligopeptide transport system permease protein
VHVRAREEDRFAAAQGELCRRLWQNRAATLAACLLALAAIASILGPPLLGLLGQHDYQSQDLAYGAHPPSVLHLFGTDLLGRDLLTRTLLALRVSLGLGLVAAAVAAALGAVYGATAALAGGLPERLMMRAVDVCYVLPFMFAVIVAAAVFGPSLGILLAMLALAGWPTTARLVRGHVLALKERPFIEAARLAGATEKRILFGHLLPNTLGPLIVYFSLTVPTMVTQEAFLSFLGLGVQPPRPSLGLLVAEGVAQMSVSWWTLLFPGLCMAGLLCALHFLGDGLRDALDPRG